MVIWTEPSIQDLTNFIDNAKEGTEKVAKDYIKKSIDYTELLDTMNNLGIKVNENKTAYDIRQLIYKSHRILYQKRENGINILGVIHSKQDFSNVIKKIFKLNNHYKQYVNNTVYIGYYFALKLYNYTVKEEYDI